MTDLASNRDTCNQNLQNVCRLCLSEESLEDIFEQKDLTVWISNLLSIVVSQSDQTSHWICVLCQIRLREFREYQSRCLEVQEVLLSESSTVDDVLIEDSLWAKGISKADHEEDESNIYNLSLITVSVPQTKFTTAPEIPTKEPKSSFKGCYKGRHIKCDICGKVVQKLRFDNHMNGHLGIRPYKCERGCPEEFFACKYKRQEHYRRVHFGYTYECTLCDKSFGTRQGLFYHKQRKHNSHECTVCHQKFASKTLLRRHGMVHTAVAFIPSSVT